MFVSSDKQLIINQMVEAIVSWILTTYLKPYFSNFSKQNIQMSLLSGEVTLKQLFFNDNILDEFSLPLKLKFGNLDELKVVIHSYVNLAKEGLTIKMKNIFLTFEMLDVQKWSEPNVINSYQNSKKNKLDTYEQNVDQFFSYLLKEGGKQHTDSDSFNIIANLAVEVENVFIRFEDSNLKFDIGVLIPKIEISSLNRFWQPTKPVEDTAILFKGITISKMDAYINYGSRFKPLSKIIDIEAFKDIGKLKSTEKDKLEESLRSFIKKTFENSSQRFSQLNTGWFATLNQYVFKTSHFSVDTRFQKTLNKRKLLQENPDFKEPDIKMEMIFGGYFKKRAASSRDNLESMATQRAESRGHMFNVIQGFNSYTPAPKVVDDSLNSQLRSMNVSQAIGDTTNRDDIQDESLSLVLDEQQLKASLHFTTFMACYSDFSQGVIESRFYRKEAKGFTLERFDAYLAMYKLYRKAKFRGDKVTAQNLQEQLHHEFEVELRSDVLLMMRDAETERFFGKKKIKMEDQRTKRHGKNKSYLPSITELMGTQNVVDPLKEKEIEDQVHAKRVKVLEEYNERLEAIKNLLNLNHNPQLENSKLKEDTEKMTQSTRMQFIFRMPKLEVELFVMEQEDFTAQSDQAVPDFNFSKNQHSTAFMSFSGLSVDFSYQTLPVNKVVKVELKNFLLKDPQIAQQVKQLNKNLPKNKVIIDSVIETRFNVDQLNETIESQNPFARHQHEPRLLILNVTIGQDEDKPQSDLQASKDDVKTESVKKDLKFNIDLAVLGKIVIFLNFAFVKRIMQLAGRVSADILSKRLFLIKSLEGDKMELCSPEQKLVQSKIREHIINGFAFVSRLSDYAKNQVEQLKLKRLHQSGSANMLNLCISAFSPKFIIDEYLFGEPVLEKKRPVYFLLDMGKLYIDNKVYHQTTETIRGNNDKQTDFYESFDMKFVDLKITHSHVDVLSLLDQSRVDETFQVFEKFDFGIQYQRRLLNEASQLPNSIVNLKLNKVRLNFDRVILMQLFKVKSFYFFGTWNHAADFMSNQLGRMHSEFKKLSRSNDNKVSYVSVGLSNISSDLKITLPKLDKQPEAEDTMRVNILFNGMQLTLYKIDWTVLKETDHAMQIGLLLAPHISMAVHKTKLLQFGAEQLKIAVLLYDQTSMDTYVFLQALTVTDLEHTGHKFTQLILSKTPGGTHPPPQGPRKSAVMEKNAIMKRISLAALARSSPQMKEIKENDLSQSFQLNDSLNQHISPFKDSATLDPIRRLIFQNRKSLTTQSQELSFEDFNHFCPIQEYADEVHQIAVKYTSTRVLQHGQDSFFGPQEQCHMAAEDPNHICRIDSSQTAVKIKKIKLVALLDMIVLVIQSQYNYLEDLRQSDERYKSHVSQHLKDSKDTKKSTINVEIGKLGQSASGIQLEMTEDENESTTSIQIEQLNKQPPVKVQTLQAIQISMPEFSISVPTNLMDSKCLQLKINTGFNYASNYDAVSEQIQLVDDDYKPVRLEEKVLEYKSNMQLKLVQLQMYMKYKHEEERKQKKNGTDNLSRVDKTFKEGDWTPPVDQSIAKGSHRTHKKKAVESLAKSQIIFPFDLTYTNDQHVLTSEKIRRDDIFVDMQHINKIESPFKRLQSVKMLVDSKKGHIGSLGKSTTDVKMHNPFKLQLKIVEVALYQELLQLLLFYNNKILALKPEMMPPARRNSSVHAPSEFSRDLTSIERQASQKTPELRSFTLQEVAEAQKITRNNTITSHPSPHGLRTSAKRALQHLCQEELQMKRDEIQEEISDHQSVDLDAQSEANNNEKTVKDVMSIEDLIKQHTSTHQSRTMFRKLIQGIDSANRNVCYSKISFSSQDSFQICLQDDVTALYEESLLAFVANEFVFDSEGVTTDTQTQVKAEKQFDMDKQRLIKYFSKSMPSDLLSYKQMIKLRLEVSNFNHKSLFQEYLIEPYSLKFKALQKTPLSQYVMTIVSKDIFNVNVTFGFFLSIEKAFAEIKEEIKQRRDEFHGRGQDGEQTKWGTKEKRNQPEAHLLDIISEEAKDSDSAGGSIMGLEKSESDSSAFQTKMHHQTRHADALVEQQAEDAVTKQLIGQRSSVSAKIGRKSGIMKAPTDAQVKKHADDHRTGKLDPVNMLADLDRLFHQSEDYQQVLLAAQQFDDTRRKHIIPKFTFLNDLGKDLQFTINNEPGLINFDDINYWSDHGLRNVWTMKAGDYIEGKHAKDINNKIHELLKSFNTDELKRAQLYISIKIDGYHVLHDFPLFQLGLFTFKLKPFRDQKNKKQPAQYMVIQLVRNKIDIKLSFESNAVVYNNTNEKITMVAFDPVPIMNQVELSQPRDIVADIYDCDPHQVVCLPLHWFERKYQIQAHFASAKLDVQEGKGNKDRKILNFIFIRKLWLFGSQNIHKVLDPVITEPYTSHAKQLQSDAGIWFGLEFALLDTRTEFGQFVLTFDYLNSFHNLLLTKLSLIRRVKRNLNAQEANRSEALVVQNDGSAVVQKYEFEPAQFLQIPQLNLQALQCDLELSFQADEFHEYSAILNQADLTNLKGSTLLQLSSGTLIELKIKKALLQQTTNLEALGPLEQHSINIVLEKLQGQGCLKDTEYNNFGLRRKIYHQKICNIYQFFAPLIAVNLSPYEITLIHKTKDAEVKQRMKPHSNLYINLSLNSRQRFRIQVPKFQESQKISLQVGQSYISMEKTLEEDQKATETKQKVEKIEMACSVQNLDQPYNKTRVLRIVQRYVVLNKLNRDIVLNQVGQEDEVLIKKLSSMDLNFTAENDACLLRIRQASRHDYNQIGGDMPESFFVINNRHQLSRGQSRLTDKWSYTFSTKDIADFQIVLPKFESNLTIREGQDSQRAWNNAKSSYYARVTVTSDFVDQGKLFIIISSPRSPDHFFINYLDFPLLFREKDSKKREFLHAKKDVNSVENRTFMIKAAKTNYGSRLSEQENGINDIDPSAVAFVLNPLLPIDINVLEIYEEENEVNQKYEFDLDNEDKKTNFTFQRSGNKGSVEVQMRMRESGGTRIVEIYPTKFQDKIKQDIQAQDREQQKNDLKEQIQTLELNMDNKQKDWSSSVSDTKQIVKLQGIGLSMVDFEPKELCYVSFEGIKIENVVSTYKKGSFQKTFSDIRVLLRNFQIDATDNAIYPILFGPVDPFRNIERQFRKNHNLPYEARKKPYLEIDFFSTQENDGEIETKAIQWFYFDIADSVVQVHISFIAQVQDMIFSFQDLLKEQEVVWQSKIYENFGIINELLANKCKESFSQVPPNKKQESVVPQVGQEMYAPINTRIRGKCDNLRQIRQEVTLSIVSAVTASPRCMVAQTRDFQDFTDLRDVFSDVETQSELQLKQIFKAKFGTKEFECPILNACEKEDQIANNQQLSYQKIFVEQIHIHPIKFIVSLKLRGIEQVLNKKGPLGFLLNLGSNFADISDAAFVFDELTLDLVHEPQEVLMNNLMSHYKALAVQQFYQFFSSQDILGNPSSFVANLGRGAGELKTAPFEILLEDDPKKAGLGVVKAVSGLLKNTVLAVSTSNSGISGSLYLGLKNIGGAKLTHENLDAPLSVKGGFKKGIIGFAKEIETGIEAPYIIPRDRIRRQGFGVRQLAKGIGQGIFALSAAPINSFLRLSYNISTGIKNQALGKQHHSQRFRHPRHFDQNQRMHQYDPLYAHAQTSLSQVNGGIYGKEVIHFAIDYSTIENDYFYERVLLITNQAIMFCQDLKTCKIRVPLSHVRGMMIHFKHGAKMQNQQNSINLELETGSIVKIQTNDPAKNKRFLSELKKYLKQLSKQQDQKNQQMEQNILKHQSSVKLLHERRRFDSEEVSFELWEEDSEEIEKEEQHVKNKGQLQPLKLHRSRQQAQKNEQKMPLNHSEDGIPSSLEEYHDSDWTMEEYYEYGDEEDL